MPRSWISWKHRKLVKNFKDVRDMCSLSSCFRWNIRYRYTIYFRYQAYVSAILDFLHRCENFVVEKRVQAPFVYRGGQIWRSSSTICPQTSQLQEANSGDHLRMDSTIFKTYALENDEVVVPQPRGRILSLWSTYFAAILSMKEKFFLISPWELYQIITR